MLFKWCCFSACPRIQCPWAWQAVEIHNGHNILRPCKWCQSKNSWRILSPSHWTKSSTSLMYGTKLIYVIFVFYNTSLTITRSSGLNLNYKLPNVLLWPRRTNWLQMKMGGTLEDATNVHNRLKATNQLSSVELAIGHKLIYGSMYNLTPWNSTSTHNLLIHSNWQYKLIVTRRFKILVGFEYHGNQTTFVFWDREAAELLETLIATLRVY